MRRGGDMIGRLLEAFLQPLPVQAAVLLDEALGQVTDRCGRHERDREEEDQDAPG